MTQAAAAATPPGSRTRPLTTGDRAFLHFTRLNPGESLEIGVVLHVDDPTLTVEELRGQVAQRLRGAPALTERLAPPAASASEIVWEFDHELDLDYHVDAEELAAGSGDAGLRAALDRIAARPLDVDRPLWRLWLLHGHTPGAVDVVYRFSHVHQDGGALHQALHLLFGPDRDPALANLPTYGMPRARDYARIVARLPGEIPWTRQLASWGGAARGGARHTWAVTDLETLRRIARRHAVTINDVYLAAIAGALRAWSLPEWEHGGRPVHAAVPINLRAQSERELMSNFTFGMRVPLPCAEPDPHRRLARIAARTRRAKADGSLAVVGRRILDTTPPDAPPRTLAQIASTGARTKRAALVASNVGTMRGPFSIAGREVSTLIGMPPLFVGRQHLSVALFGLGAQLCAGFAASASVPRHGELADLWLAELAALDAPARRASVPAGNRGESS
ncbi:wax ester/triacylglycerol synthase domain-containing protein [Frankia sp. AgKG'84/4]|uniref:wax ester/triacylglycerol synthase domain-containing protein n=1 Tax=Frankia sp. AgKG'84/4 TaxID=573490 RepID=UPI00200CE021|nr:wax ester/triacylglycerol synthase domain-containing protein [Frankia sp. AgKG'84/4]MCL9796030.1 WS/DGAT domain-containing protein [Frankia sp. AgKG'84/4]